MRRNAATVHVIALVDDSDAFLSTTATAVTLTTMDPATMLVCLNGSTRIGDAIMRATTFSINALTITQVHVAAACAGGREHSKRFETADWVLDDDGVPYLRDAQSSMVCEVEDIVVSGTHNVVFGRVRVARYLPTVAPLIYLNRSYGQFRASEAHDLSRHLFGW